MTEEPKPKARPKSRLQRVISLDVIRGIAAFLMVQGHFIYATVNSYGFNPLVPKIQPNFWFTKLYFFVSEYFVYSLGWSMFFLLIGIGLAISIVMQKMKKVPFKTRLIHILKRTGFFLLVQYVFNIVSYAFLTPPDPITYLLALGNVPPTDIFFYLNPITSFSFSSLIAEIGVWSLVVFFLMELPMVVRVTVAIVMGYVGYYVIFLRGNMFVFILVGGIFGSYLMNELVQGNQDKVLKIFLVTGMVFLGTGLPLHLLNLNTVMNSIVVLNYGDLLGSPGYILYSTGVIWILFAIFYWIIDQKKNYHKGFRPFVLLGNLTLTIYVLHYILLNQMTYSLGFDQYFFLPMGWIWNFALIIFMYIGAVYWSRSKFKYSLEWIVQRIR